MLRVITKKWDDEEADWVIDQAREFEPREARRADGKFSAAVQSMIDQALVDGAMVSMYNFENTNLG